MLVETVQLNRIQHAKNQKTNYKAQSLNPIPFNGLTEIKAAEKLVNMHSYISGGLGFILSQIAGVDGISHLANNTLMIKSIVKKVYKSDIDKGEVNRFITNSLITAGGVKTATGLVGFVPIIGNIINSAVCAGITKTVGQKFIKVCEKESALKISKQLIA